ncbi:MAG: hypothetical protein KKC25_02440 [Proteobacteria bacterium]|nr:hypothetical protein [Pseudomonadota bacterium]MBU2262958.1 hypothetical protein [Pseudomonadota bacterium]
MPRTRKGNQPLRLKTQGEIPYNWISEDYRAKRSYDVTTKSVTISTIHSVKGFDYACVFLLGLDWLAPRTLALLSALNVDCIAIDEVH